MPLTVGNFSPTVERQTTFGSSGTSTYRFQRDHLQWQVILVFDRITKSSLLKHLNRSRKEYEGANMGIR